MLAVIIGNAELALDDVDLDSIRGNLDQILSASKRSRDLVRQILTFGRKREGQRRPLKLTQLIEETITLLRGSLPSTVRIKTDIRTESDTIIGDTSQIQQVLMNLATNAVHAMAHEGTLAVRLSEKTFRKGQQLPDPDLRPGRHLKLTVRDTGTGIAADIQKRMFDPFFTTKDPGQGTGMGLAVVYGIVKSHGGAITVSSKTGKGSIFSIFLPAATEAVAEKSIPESPLPRGTERVLVVDDEASVVAVVSETMKRLGYRVTTALSGAEGWKKFAQTPSRFDLVITDQIMPEITGIWLSERMLEVRPDLPVILCTGYSETVSAEEAAAAGISEFLMKPIEAKSLAETVRKVLDRRNEVRLNQ
jgi:CheY-like chemotaxis protein